MDNYWFLYNINDGSIYGSPYKGGTTEWTNIPENCGVIGFVDDKVTDIVKDAFEKSLKYKIVNNELTVNSDYVEPTIFVVPTLEERLASAESALSALLGV
jgi:hypothetical protein